MQSIILVRAVLRSRRFGASTFAPFSDTDTTSGTVTASVLQVDLADVGSSPEEASLTFDTDPECGSEITPVTDPCVVLIQICNGTSATGTYSNTGSNVEVYISAATIIETENDTDDCFDGTLTESEALVVISDASVGVGEEPGDDDAAFTVGTAATESLDPGDSADVTLTIVLLDDNKCQGDSATYQLDVTATQTNTPHD